jgi:hypothetical protein
VRLAMSTAQKRVANETSSTVSSEKKKKIRED